MFIALPKDTFIRQYGDYTYIFNQRTSSDYVFQDAGVFFEKIGRIPCSKDDIINNIIEKYDVDKSEVASDFFAIFEPLIKSGVIVASDVPDDIILEKSNETGSMSADGDFNYNLHNLEYTSQEVMQQYFNAHPTAFVLHCDITSACTERCIHCYIPEHKNAHMKTSKIFSVIDEFSELGGLKICFSGGECMLHPDFVKILKYARQKDLSISLMSNLTCCDSEMISILKEINIASLQVSLYSMDSEIHDSITQIPGSFNQTIHSLLELHANKIPIQISCPTMKKNYAGYKDVLQFAAQHNIPAYTDFILMARSDHSTDNLTQRLSLSEAEYLMRDMLDHSYRYASRILSQTEFEKIAIPSADWEEEQICGAGISSICLNSNGEYYPCAGFQNYPVGNCNKQTLREVWENSPQLKYLRSLKRKNLEKCVKCENRNFCSICLVRNFNENKNMLQPNEHYCNIASINRRLVEEYRAAHENLQ